MHNEDEKIEKDLKRELAFNLYRDGKKYAVIAEEVGVTVSAVKSWAARYWNSKKVATSKKEKGKLQPKKKVATKSPPKTKSGKRSMKGRNPNSHHNGTGPPGNKNGEKHGLFAKILPKETLELVDGIEQLNTLDILWDNIKIQYAAILRSQRIMYVANEKDITKEISSEGENVTSYMIQTATDKQASFLTAQSRAMQSLGSMIKQYDDLMRSELATEEQKARIEVLKAKINQTSISDDLSKLDELLSGITEIAKETEDETDS